MKIATHNSGTGEKSGGLLSTLLTPFAKCQSKTILEQYEAGCRYFDLRLRKVKGEYALCHGLWESATTLNEVLLQLGRKGMQKVYVMLTYEGECKDKAAFVDDMLSATKSYGNIFVTTINAKKPKWECLATIHDVSYRNAYKVLDGSSWHTYLPIPWLWAKLKQKKVFNNSAFTFVDFL